MPSELPIVSAEPPRRAGWLRSQGLGILCGQATVLLLAIGSFVLAGSGRGAMRGLADDDLRFVFRDPSLRHLWLYLLFPVLALWGANTALCTWDNVLSRWRRGIRTLAAYGPAVIHLSFLVGLAAHAVQGFFAVEATPIFVGETPVALGDGRSVRLVRTEVESWPGGMPKRIRAHVVVGDSNGTREETVGINEPLTSGLGSRLFLFADRGRLFNSATFEAGREGRLFLTPGKAVRLADGRTFRLLELGELEEGSGEPAALVSVESPSAPPERAVVTRQSAHLFGETPVVLGEVGTAEWIALRPRRAPGVPIALVSALLLFAGAAMMGRRWFSRPD